MGKARVRVFGVTPRVFAIRDETPVIAGEIPNFLVLSHGARAC